MCEGVVSADIDLFLAKNVEVMSDCFYFKMDPKGFYGVRVPPAEESEDSCLSDSDTDEYSPSTYFALPTEESDSETVSSWLMYRRDCDALAVPKKEQLDLLMFKASVASCLSHHRHPNTSMSPPPPHRKSNHRKRLTAGHHSQVPPPVALREYHAADSMRNSARARYSRRPSAALLTLLTITEKSCASDRDSNT
ncbi:hypothetical protein HPB47_004596 [Ixodes persulcatus]|uniref:Uncharacterized protein n=1 Tax=Ixodes persulcatus TaxID=34615 RepID=A0AC60PFA2_IXOPE|nr:hypothetical protein HPB47_004596 [Ixodes persulcatus]